MEYYNKRVDNEIIFKNHANMSFIFKSKCRGNLRVY